MRTAHVGVRKGHRAVPGWDHGLFDLWGKVA
jgi:hypothetical protein